MTKHDDKKSSKKDKSGAKHKESKKEHEPAAPPTTASVYPEGFRMADGLSKKDRQKLEKIVANIEYAEAHGETEQAEKFRERLNQVNEEARAKAAHKDEVVAERAKKGQGNATKVVHSGRTHSKQVQANA